MKISLVNNESVKLIRITEQEFEDFLVSSKSEEAMFDFKQGFLQLSPNRKFDENSFLKIMKNTCAMANHGGKR